jgi:hypothetical protein
MDAALSALKREAALHPERPELCAACLSGRRGDAGYYCRRPICPASEHLLLDQTNGEAVRAGSRSIADWPTIELIV